MTIPGAPSPQQIDEWKAGVPGHRVKLFLVPPLGKHVFILRALSGIEMKRIAKSIPENSDNVEREIILQAVSAAVLWTNMTADKKIDPLILEAGPAGLPDSLMVIVNELNQFHDPQIIHANTGDL